MVVTEAADGVKEGESGSTAGGMAKGVAEEHVEGDAGEMLLARHARDVATTLLCNEGGESGEGGKGGDGTRGEGFEGSKGSKANREAASEGGEGGGGSEAKSCQGAGEEGGGESRGGGGAQGGGGGGGTPR